ncbi:MAG: MgtC/SapB family protein [Dehalococcoidia bacterium]|nr:MgtC/SapB family protein [Dehalococcoidia bacterium]
MLRLLMTTALGDSIGYQRERAGKAAGMCTYGLVSLGAALFTITSIYAFGASSDPSRVAAEIVTDIGFLGALGLAAGAPVCIYSLWQPPP